MFSQSDDGRMAQRDGTGTVLPVLQRTKDRLALNDLHQLPVVPDEAPL